MFFLSITKKKLIKAIASSIVFFCLVQTAYSQLPPNAGSVSRDAIAPRLASPQNNATLPQIDAVVPSTTKSTDPTPIAVKSINITGATLFSPDTLQALIANVATGNRTLGELQNAAGRITAHYRKSGYFLARAYLPAQKMEDGQVTIVVLEGKLTEVQVQNTSRISDAAATARLAGLAPGTVMQRAAVDRALLLLGDVPGVGGVDSRLTPGANTGETVLVAVVRPAPAWSGKVDADNYGSLYSGRYRLGGSIDGNSPLGFGERISATLLVSNEKLVYGRAGVQAPIGASGLTVGAGFNHSQYLLADVYKELDAVGYSDTFEVNARYPLVRSVPFNLYGQAGAEHRKLHDDVRSTNTQTDKRANVATLGLQADWRDSLGGWGADSQAGITLIGGKLKIITEDAAAIDARGANTAGSYGKVSINLGRQQALIDKLSLGAQLRGQWASKNLDSSEKLSLGGISGVRAYPAGEAAGDSGWVGSLELRYAVLSQVAASVFYDAGSINVNANPYLPTANKRSLSGAGVGLAGVYEALDWRMSLAWRTSEAATYEPDKKPRFWAQAGWRF